MSARGYKQNSSGGFFTVNNTLAADRGSSGPFLANTGTDAAPVFSTNIHSVSTFTSTLLATGKILKDMSKTLVSSGRVFRKVQMVVNAAGGVGGVAASGSGQAPIPDYLTGYVEVPNVDGLNGTAPGAGQLAANIIRLG